MRLCVSLALSTLLLGAIFWLGRGAGAAAQRTSPPPPAEALELRNLGFALLENEKDAEAEQAFRQLVQVYPDDPLGYANLAIAQLRQQNSSGALASINQALSKAPDRADLIAIRADVVAWIGDAEAALTLYRRATDLAPENPELQYALYRHTTSMTTDEAAAVGRAAAAALSRMRPENLVVLLAHGRAAIETGDRAVATSVYLRVRELAWQLDARTKPLADRTLPPLLEALEENDMAAARVPSQRLENVFRGSGAYKSSLAELFKGIQGVPIERFVSEPTAALSPPQTVAFSRPLRLSTTMRRTGSRPSSSTRHHSTSCRRRPPPAPLG